MTRSEIIDYLAEKYPGLTFRRYSYIGWDEGWAATVAIVEFTSAENAKTVQSCTEATPASFSKKRLDTAIANGCRARAETTLKAAIMLEKYAK